MKNWPVRVRELISESHPVAEKKMFRGLTFMVNGKMCVSVSGDELMCRIDPALTEPMLKMSGVRPMIRLGKIMKGYIYISPENLKTPKQLFYWVRLCLDFNHQAKAAKKNKKINRLPKHS